MWKKTSLECQESEVVKRGDLVVNNLLWFCFLESRMARNERKDALVMQWGECV